MKTTFLWSAALCITAALSFYGGHYRATSLALKAATGESVTLAKMHIDLLKAGRVDEDIALNTKLMDFGLRDFQQGQPLYSPLDILTSAQPYEQRSVPTAVRDTHYNHPELSFRAETLASVAEFEKGFPYSFSAAHH